MRRFVLVLLLSGIALLGLGAAYVVAVVPVRHVRNTGVTLCHHNEGSKDFTSNTVDASAIVNDKGELEGHGLHPDDIIPPFEIILSDGTEYDYPGQNMDTQYINPDTGWVATGAEVLANDCMIPAGPPSTGTTETVTTTVTQTVPVTVTQPGQTVTLPGTTTTETITVAVTAPSVTVTTPGATTVVTVPAGETKTVTLPADTVTLPAVTQTVPGATVDRPPVTVTVPGTVQTVTSGSKTAVVTIAAPGHPDAEGEVLGKRKVVVTVTTPTSTVHLPGHVVHVMDHTTGKTEKVVVIVLRCPPGDVVADGKCTLHSGIGLG